jgi:hypothetical protein
VDKVDKHPWPPDELLVAVGMNRREWDEMARFMGPGTIPVDWLIESAAKKIARRRQDDLARVKREA